MIGKKEQEDDPIIGPVIQAKRSKKYDTSGINDDSKRLLHGRSRLFFAVVCYAEKYSMVSCRKINFSLCFQNLIGNSH